MSRMPVWMVLALGVVSALSWLTFQYLVGDLMYAALWLVAAALLFSHATDVTFWGWLWRAPLLGVSNLATQCFVLFGLGLTEPYLQRLVPQPPIDPIDIGITGQVTLVLSVLLGAGVPVLGATLGFGIAMFQRPRRRPDSRIGQ